MKESEWCQVDYEPAAESFMFDLFFECAPEGLQNVSFALGEFELNELERAIKRARVSHLMQRPHSDVASQESWPPTSSEGK